MCAMNKAPPASETKAKFGLPLWAIAIGVVLLLGWLALDLRANKFDSSPEAVGRIVGAIGAMAGISLAAAWVVFHLLKRADHAAPAAFIAVLLFVIQSQFRPATVIDADEKLAVVGAELLEATSDEEVESAVANAMDELAEQDPMLARALNESKEISEGPFDRFTQAQDVVATERFLNFEAMRKEGEYTWQRETVLGLQTAATDLAEAMTKTRLDVYAALNSTTIDKKFAGGIRKGYDKSVGPIIDFAKEYQKLAVSYDILIEFLESEHGSWKLSEELTPVFDKPDLQGRYDAMLSAIAKLEEEANALLDGLSQEPAPTPAAPTPAPTPEPKPVKR